MVAGLGVMFGKKGDPPPPNPFRPVKAKPPAPRVKTEAELEAENKLGWELLGRGLRAVAAR